MLASAIAVALAFLAGSTVRISETKRNEHYKLTVHTSFYLLICLNVTCVVVIIIVVVAVVVIVFATVVAAGYRW